MPPAIRDASPAETGLVRQLFLEYQKALGVDLCFQGFDEELKTLPGKYARPKGRLLLAEDNGSILGVVALRPLEGGDCEMKRLYVRPAGRGRGVGRLLAARLIEEARGEGYSRMLLDTLPSMAEAQALYRSLGFAEIGAYTHNPIGGTLYMALTLRPLP